MKHYTRKNKIFPLATTQKKQVNQPWNYFTKKKSQKLVKQKSRFFSMEFGRSFSKRILWQIAVNNSFLKKANGFSTKEIPEKTLKSLHLFLGKTNTKHVSLSKTGFLYKKCGPYQQSWKAFRSILFAKMWMLYDPSLVPGIAWPIKQKKILLAKIRALKALSMLVGNPSLKYLTQNLQKFSQVSGQTTPILWSIALGLDCFKTNVLVKSNMIGTIPAANHSLCSGYFYLNGVRNQKSLGLNYAGDIISWNHPDFNQPELANSSYFFGNLFQYGSLKNACTKMTTNSMKPFIWLSSFYSSGQVVDFFGQQKKTLKKRRFYDKKMFFKLK